MTSSRATVGLYRFAGNRDVCLRGSSRRSKEKLLTVDLVQPHLDLISTLSCMSLGPEVESAVRLAQEADASNKHDATSIDVRCRNNKGFLSFSSEANAQHLTPAPQCFDHPKCA